MNLLYTAKTEDFTATLEDTNPPRIIIEGRAEGTAAKDVLGPFLKDTDAALMKLAVKSVDVDLQKLTFMSSSCFKDFVVWLSDLSGRPSAQQYRVRFLSNAKVRWQRGSLSSLACFAPAQVDIVTD